MYTEKIQNWTRQKIPIKNYNKMDWLKFYLMILSKNNKMILSDYIYHFNFERIQSKLKGMTPFEYISHSYNAIYF